MNVLSKEVQELILHDGTKLRETLERFRQFPLVTSVSFRDHRGRWCTIERCLPPQTGAAELTIHDALLS